MARTAGTDGGPWPGLRPAADEAGPTWFTDRMRGRQGVALVVPDGFEAQARILHPRDDARAWAEVEPRMLEVGPDTTWGPDHWTELGATGELPPAAVDALVPLLETATSTPEVAHYGLWIGWGDLRPGSSTRIYAPAPAGRLGRWRHERAVRRAEEARKRATAPVYDLVRACPVVEWWGGRDMVLLDGPVAAVASLRPDPSTEGSFGRRSPQWWWPEDRAWFVATEIDDAWSYVAGSAALVDAVVGDGRWEAVRVSPLDPW